MEVRAYCRNARCIIWEVWREEERKDRCYPGYFLSKFFYAAVTTGSISHIPIIFNNLKNTFILHPLLISTYGFKCFMFVSK
jgi:hypothetical protein